MSIDVIYNDLLCGLKYKLALLHNLTYLYIMSHLFPIGLGRYKL